MGKTEYWHIEPTIEQRIRDFWDNPSEPDLEQQYEVAEKDFVNAGRASSDIKNLLKKLGVNPVVLRRVAVASYEAEINIAAHSKGGYIKCYIYGELINILFEDKGPGIKDIKKALEPGFSTADELVREMGFGAGLGLPNIKKNSDVMHIISAEGENTRLEIIIFY